MARQIDTQAIVNWIRMKEQAGNPANPAVGYWRYFFKSDGLYYLEDDGTATGPLDVGASVTYTAAQGSRPAADADGNLFLPSDGIGIERDTGVAWSPWGPIFPITAPVNADFSWDNQGGAVMTSNSGSMYMNMTADPDTELYVRYKSAPSPPYVLEVGYFHVARRLQFVETGLCFRQSSDGKLSPISLGQINSGIVVAKWNNSTSYNSFYVQITEFRQDIIWMKIEDDNTDRIYSWSPNGKDWRVVHQVGRTDFLTADQIGFCMKCDNNLSPEADMGMRIFHWRES